MILMKGGIAVNTATITAVLAIAAILFFAARYIYKEKKKGKACIGCPYADSCPKHNQTVSTCRGTSVTDRTGREV